VFDLSLISMRGGGVDVRNDILLVVCSGPNPQTNIDASNP